MTTKTSLAVLVLMGGVSLMAVAQEPAPASPAAVAPASKDTEKQTKADIKADKSKEKADKAAQKQQKATDKAAKKQAQANKEAEKAGGATPKQ